MKVGFPTLAAVLAVLATQALAADPEAPVSRPIAAFTLTQGGQPILLPQGPVQVSASETIIPSGGVIGAHKHPHQRMAYILEGRIRVTNLDTGAVVDLKPGDLGVEARDQWHEGRALGDAPVRMLVIDQAPPGASNVLRRQP